MCRRLLLVILLFTWLTVAFGDSVRPAGKDTSHKQDNQKSNPCPDPRNPNMVQRPNTTIKGKDGDTVILPCSTKNKTDISNKKIEWFKGPTTEDKPIHKYVRRFDPPQTQRDDFKNRTSLSEEGLLSGDCSLNLTVNTSHSGLYYCCVPGLLYCLVNLKVHPKGKDTSQEQDNRNDGTDGPTPNNWITGAVAAAFVVAALISLGVYCYYGSGQNSNNPPINLELPLRAQQPPQDEGNEPVDQNSQEQMLLDVIVDQGDPADGNVRSRSRRSTEN
ncbi:uncharacterized protein LOC115589823 isoform X2 [Sparus aurata]|uniref:uncharacterized protein LOC115589823 isoform X2 n=1 Tax=Sparus aurata TaxID=8175 RepID=UPI0011C0CCC9|nr:uncharacterized protein LOC115589823 isoform X2 [Sparus aurata]